MEEENTDPTSRVVEIELEGPGDEDECSGSFAESPSRFQEIYLPLAEKVGYHDLWMYVHAASEIEYLVAETVKSAYVDDPPKDGPLDFIPLARDEYEFAAKEQLLSAPRFASPLLKRDSQWETGSRCLDYSLSHKGQGVSFERFEYLRTPTIFAVHPDDLIKSASADVINNALREFHFTCWTNHLRLAGEAIAYVAFEEKRYGGIDRAWYEIIGFGGVDSDNDYGAFNQQAMLIRNSTKKYLQMLFRGHTAPTIEGKQVDQSDTALRDYLRGADFTGEEHGETDAPGYDREKGVVIADIVNKNLGFVLRMYRRIEKKSGSAFDLRALALTALLSPEGAEIRESLETPNTIRRMVWFGKECEGKFRKKWADLYDEETGLVTKTEHGTPADQIQAFANEFEADGDTANANNLRIVAGRVRMYDALHSKTKDGRPVFRVWRKRDNRFPFRPVDDDFEGCDWDASARDAWSIDEDTVEGSTGKYVRVGVAIQNFEKELAQAIGQNAPRVLRCWVLGCTQEETARQLNVGRKTVRNLRDKIKNWRWQDGLKRFGLTSNDYMTAVSELD